MSLIKCPECGKEISNQATSCPYCGYPICGEQIEDVQEKESIAGKDETVKRDNKEVGKIKKKLSKKSIIAIISIIVVLIIGVIIYFLITADARSYNYAKRLYKNEEYQQALDRFSSLDDYKDSKKMVNKCEYQLSVDGQFINALSKGLMARWDESDKEEAKGNIFEDPDLYSKYCDIELDYVEQFYDQTFNNLDLQKNAKLYIDYLNKAKDATKYYTIDYNTFSTQWSETYAERVLLLRKFIDNYGLTVDETHQDILDDLMVDASAAQEQLNLKSEVQEMLKNFQVNTIEDEWGYKTYKISMKNITNQTFNYFYVDVNVLDKNGTIISTGSSNQITSWEPEQEAVVDAYFDGEIDPNEYTLEYTPHYQAGTYYE